MLYLLYGMMTGFIFAFIGYRKNYSTVEAFLADPLPADLPSVAAVIAAKNEEYVIETTVRELLEKAPVDFKLIVVDDNSIDSTPSILAKLKREFGNLVVLRNTGTPGKPGALNVALRNIKEDLVLFLDADARVDWSFVRQYAGMFSGRDIDVIFADFQPGNRSRTPAVIFQDVFFAFSKTFVFSGLFSKTAFMNSGVFMRRSLFEEVGEFDPYTTVDDFDLAMRLWQKGKKIRFVTARPCTIQYAVTLKDLFKQYSRWQTGIIRELFKAIKTGNKYALRTLITGGLMIYSPVLALITGSLPGLEFMSTAVLPFILGTIYCEGLFGYIYHERRRTGELIINAIIGLPVILVGYQLTLFISIFRAFTKRNTWYKVQREDLREAESEV